MCDPIVFLKRRETFSASHRLHSNDLTDEENLKIYGKCNHINGHGHNYVVEITVRGPVNQKTGMVMNITTLKGYIERVMANLDHKNLDKDVSYFKSRPSTTENLAIYIWDSLHGIMEESDLLYEVRIEETEKNSVIYRGPYLANYYKTDIKRRQRNSCTNISSDSD